MKPDVLCIGSVLWDVIGSPDPRLADRMGPGSDLPGRIVRVPGGVALNIAVTLRRLGMRPALLAAVGLDAEGCALVEGCAAMGLVTDHLHRTTDPTDRFMAIEGPRGLLGAIADTRTLEAAGPRILDALSDGRIERPWRGLVVLDSNVTGPLLSEIARSPLLAEADLRIVPASPGKAARLARALGHPTATLYLNTEEASIVLGAPVAGAEEAAQALRARGAARAVVTDGPRPAADASAAGLHVAAPRSVEPVRELGAGDTFMAAHIAAEARGAGPHAALEAALDAAADHVAGLA